MDIARSFRRRHRAKLVAAGLAVTALAVFVAVWFQPQKLWIDDKVDEAVPVQAAGSDAPAERSTSTTAPLPQTEPKVVAGGEFRSLEHTTTGGAAVLELPDGQRYLRFEDLKTSNGPDLRVYLSAADAGAAESAFDDDFVELGKLKGNVGDQNYEIPAGTDLGRYRSAVIWCRRFSAGFAVAPLV